MVSAAAATHAVTFRASTSVSTSVEWGSPLAIYLPLELEFQFTIDICGSPINAKHVRYVTKDTDALALSWKGERVFCNPPYGRHLERWLHKAIYETQENDCPLVEPHPGSNRGDGRGGFISPLTPAVWEKVTSTRGQRRTKAIMRLIKRRSARRRELVTALRNLADRLGRSPLLHEVGEHILGVKIVDQRSPAAHCLGRLFYLRRGYEATWHRNALGCRRWFRLAGQVYKEQPNEFWKHAPRYKNKVDRIANQGDGSPTDHTPTDQGDAWTRT